MLERIIRLAINEDAVVLDPFCGCGTTIIAAQHLKRKWIGIDITYQSISLVLRRLARITGAVEQVQLNGVPRDIASVDALINKKDDRVRKEFEKWAILTYSENRAIINDKKGADQGIDGTAFTLGSRNDKGETQPATVIFSVKSGKVGAAFMRDLRGTIEREGAAGGILITRGEPTAAMIKEAKAAGKFRGEFTTFDRLQIVTVEEILNGARMTLPMYEVARKAKSSTSAAQTGLF